MCVETSSSFMYRRYEKQPIPHTVLVRTDKNGDNELEKVNCLRQRKYINTTLLLLLFFFCFPLLFNRCFHAKAIWNEIKISSSACCLWFNFNNLLVEKRNQWKYHIYKQSFMQKYYYCSSEYASMFKTNISFLRYSLSFVWSRNPILFMFNVRVRKSLFSRLPKSLI